MKAGPTLKRAACLRSSAKLCSFVNFGLAYSARTKLGADVFLSRKFSQSHLTSRFSLAGQIKQFLPPDAIEEEDSFVEEDVLSTPLAAYEAEVASAERLVSQNRLDEAVALLINALPLDSLLAAFKARLMATARDSPVGYLGVLELAFALYKQGSEALANQVLAEFDPSLVQNTQYFAFVLSLESSASNGILRSSELDAYLRTLLDGMNFPQMLSNSSISAWFKAHLLAQLSPSDLQRWLAKYSSHFSRESICLLASLSSIQQFRTLSDWLVKDDLEIIPSVAKLITSKEKFRVLSRKLLRQHSVLLADTAAEPILAAAIRLKQTYDVANICHHFAPALNQPTHKNLLAKALLAAAFAQPKSEDEQSIFGVVSGSNEELHTFLVERVLTPVLTDDLARNAVVASAAYRLNNLHARNVPGKVLWQLLMSLPGPLGGLANVSLARLVVKRPYLEQIRYMSLPISTSESVYQLMRWHISKVVEYRKANVVPSAQPQAKEDVQLLIVGMLLASEKQKHERGSSQTPVKVEEISMDTNIQDRSERKVSTNVVYYVVGELLKQKQYTIIKQVLSEVGLNHIPPSILNNILLRFASDQPEEVHQFARWLVEANNIRISPRCINKMMRVLTNSQLSESQLVNRFQSLRQMLVMSPKGIIEQETAVSLVNALIKSAYSRGGGSHFRLKWALETAKIAQVPDTQFDEWNETLSTMQKNGLGFWATNS